jgi:hypothetical protein
MAGVLNIHTSLVFLWFCQVVAESSRRPLSEDERRNGCTRNKLQANDGLLFERLFTDGHPLLQAIFERMVDNEDATEDYQKQIDLLDMLSTALGYHVRIPYQPTARWTAATWEKYQPVKQAFLDVFSGDPIEQYVGTMYLQERKAWFCVHYKRKPWWGLRANMPYLTRKLWELMVLPLRVLPDGVNLENRKKTLFPVLQLVDERQATPDEPLEPLHVATRLHRERFDRLVHPFPAMVIANVQAELKYQAQITGKPMTDDEIELMAFQQIDAMSGWGSDGHYVIPNTTPKKRGPNWDSVEYQPIVVAAQELAYTEYFKVPLLNDETVQEIRDEDAERSMQFRNNDIAAHRLRMRLVRAGANYKECVRRSYEAKRQKQVDAAKEHFTKMIADGYSGYLSIADENRESFCTKVLSLTESTHANIKIHDDCLFNLPGQSQQWTPLEAIQRFEGNVHVYIGITAMVVRNHRPLLHVGQKLYEKSKKNVRPLRMGGVFTF